MTVPLNICVYCIHICDTDSVAMPVVVMRSWLLVILPLRSRRFGGGALHNLVKTCWRGSGAPLVQGVWGWRFAGARGVAPRKDVCFYD